MPHMRIPVTARARRVTSATCTLACLLSFGITAPTLGQAANAPASPEEPVVKTQLDVSPPNTHYVTNRPPLLPSPLVKLPIGAVKARGWLQTQLKLEADGFIGRLDELSRFLKKEGNAWLSPTGAGGHGWEEVPYWLKGYADLGYLLGDERIITESKIWLEGALAGQRPNGYFGPQSNLTSLDGKPDLWPHMIMLNALQSYYEYSGDVRVIELMTKYFRWELQVPEENFLVPYWQQQRGADNLASVYWLYNRTGDEWLLELAEKIHRRTANWTEGVANWHGVNIAQAFRGPATYYQQSRNELHHAATWQRYRDVIDAYGQVPGGGYGSDENCRPGYTGPRQGTETCTWAELMLSFELLLKIDGDGRWADLCEEIAFNSLPASMTADLKGLRYLTAPNMVLADSQNHAPGIENGGEMLSYNPHHYRCCQHNVSHAWPYFVEHLWLGTAGDGLAAVMYAPSEVTAKVGRGVEVTIREETKYPFDDTVRFTVLAIQPVAFPLTLRVPGWCSAPVVKVNGTVTNVAAAPTSSVPREGEAPAEPSSSDRSSSEPRPAGSVSAQSEPRPAGSVRYIQIARTWNAGDTVELQLPMNIRLRTWAKNDDSISVDRGPLTYALKIGEKYARYAGTDAWPAFEVLPTTPWNYGLVLDAQNPAQSFKLETHTWDGAAQPFTLDAAPLTLQARARKIPNWKLDPQVHLVGKLQPSPAESTEPEETVTLVPMGCARLRIASFPTIGSGQNAHAWTYTDPPALASHIFDDIGALNDGKLPKNSNDHSIPRLTWWDHKGTTEWVQYNFKTPRALTRCAVYWFDDTGAGGACRVPASWRILYRVPQQADADENNTPEDWRPVETDAAYGCQPDQLNAVTFKPVTTNGLRLEVQLQPDFSGGILEWQAE